MGERNLITALRGGLLQQDRLLKLDTPLGPNVLTVQWAVVPASGVRTSSRSTCCRPVAIWNLKG